jgi:UDP-N-acetylglucosamine:LPS N-acetylglucosamine transferase
MDLSILGKQAIFIPTPGQTEQEYLAKLLMKKGLIYYQKQKYFNLQKALDEIKNYKGLGLDYKSQLAVKNNETLITEIKKLLS